MHDDQVEFAERYAAINAKLTREEQDMLMTVMSGAEVNHSMMYCVAFGVAGVLIGALGMYLLG